MDAKGLGYQRSSNCFTWLEDFAVAQHLSNARLRTNWAAALDELLRAVHPAHDHHALSVRVMRMTTPDPQIPGFHHASLRASRQASDRVALPR